MQNQPFIGVICDASFSVLAGRIKGSGYKIARVAPRMLIQGQLPAVDIWVVDCDDDDQVADALAWIETPVMALSNRPSADNQAAYQAWCARIIKTLDKWTASQWSGAQSQPSQRSFQAVEGVWMLAGGEGALDSVVEFLASMTHVPPVAFVYAQHADQDQERVLERVAAANKQIDTVLAVGRQWINPRQLLVVPTTCRLDFGSQGEVFSLRESWGGHHTPDIDWLMMAMSGMRPTPAGAIVFSGEGSDGCEGGQALLALGARVWAQDPATAAAPAMPRAMLKLRLAEHAASPRQLAADFLNLYPDSRAASSTDAAQDSSVVLQPVATAAAPAAWRDKLPADWGDAIEHIEHYPEVAAYP